MTPDRHSRLADVIPKEWIAVEPSLRTCDVCGSKKRRWLATEMHGARRQGRLRWLRVAVVQCYNTGCGALRWVQLTR